MTAKAEDWMPTESSASVVSGWERLATTESAERPIADAPIDDLDLLIAGAVIKF
jgi:hypothetical protein